MGPLSVLGPPESVSGDWAEGWAAEVCARAAGGMKASATTRSAQNHVAGGQPDWKKRIGEDVVIVELFCACCGLDVGAADRLQPMPGALPRKGTPSPHRN
jgi:hypothetical protein